MINISDDILGKIYHKNNGEWILIEKNSYIIIERKNNTEYYMRFNYRGKNCTKYSFFNLIPKETILTKLEEEMIKAL